jgi:hypothetical protein
MNFLVLKMLEITKSQAQNELKLEREEFIQI